MLSDPAALALFSLRERGLITSGQSFTGDLSPASAPNRLAHLKADRAEGPVKGWSCRSREQHCRSPQEEGRGKERQGDLQACPVRGVMEKVIFHSPCRTALLDKPSARFLQLFPRSYCRFLGGSGWNEL